MDKKSLLHTVWKCQYHIVFIPKYRKKKLYGQVRADIRNIIKILCNFGDVDGMKKSKLRSDTSIKTDRLWLRQIDETDAETIVKLRSNEDVYRYFRNPVKISIDEHNAWYKDTYCNDPNRIDWIAVDDNSGTFIGVYGVKRGDEKMAEVSYITNPMYKHKGFASEAVGAIILWCAKNWDIKYVIAEIHKDNKASLYFARKLEFYEISENEFFLQMRKIIRR